MSLPEVGHRILAALSTALQAKGLLLVPLPVKPELAVETPVWIEGVKGLRGSNYEEAGSRLLSTGHTVFVSRTASTAVPSWNRDPLTGTDAPLSFGKSIDFRDERLVGNIKYLWELNRHLELVTLAQAFARTGEERFLLGMGNRMESWLNQCPYPKGVNWASALEAGIRLINWSLAWQLIGGRESTLFSGATGAKLLERWLESVYLHVHFIRHFYSRFSSANNHLIGEAAGVYVAVCTWPFWKPFQEWGEEAKCILINAAATQTHPDGVNREQAVAYQQFVLDFFILSALAGRSRGQEFPDPYWRTIERMIEYLAALMDFGGNVPMIGDADDGFVVRLSQEAGFSPYKSLLATGAILFDRPEFAARSGGLDDKTRFLLGGKQWADLASRAVLSTESPPRQFPEGGYCILGQDFDGAHEIRLVVDSGPLGYLSIAAHGHADALAIWLSVAGKEFLVDPGTYTYHGKPAWRTYFRGTRAHNTVTVDGQDQSVQGGNFMWLKHAEARCLKFEQGSDGDLFIGEHDGYRRLRDPVSHRREIRRCGRVFEITDSLSCKGDHEIDQWWHFSEHCEVRLQDGEIRAENQGAAIRLRPAPGMVELFRGSEDPIAGWVSRRFDVKVPSTSVRVRSVIHSATSLLTTIECFPG